MSQTLHIAVKPSILERENILVIEPEFIEFHNTNMSKLEIAAIRYGIKAINGYRFRIGRIYCIDIKSVEGDVIKIRLRSVYRINRKKLEKKYIQILTALFRNFIDDICHGLVKQFHNKIDFDLLEIIFTQTGLVINKKDIFISWADLTTKKYQSYFSVFSISEPLNNISFYYLSDWNTVVFEAVIKSILKSFN